MSLPRILSLMGAVMVVSTSSASAQGMGFFFYAHGGSESALKNLDETGSSDFASGFNLGGGVGVTLHPLVALRGNFTFARNEARTPGTAFDGEKFNRYAIGGDLVLQLPLSQGSVMPYVFGGAAMVSFDPQFSTGTPPVEAQGFIKPAGRFGAGLSFNLPGTSVGLFAEGTGLVYSFDELGFDRTQFDLLVNVGLSYSIPMF